MSLFPRTGVRILLVGAAASLTYVAACTDSPQASTSSSGTASSSGEASSSGMISSSGGSSSGNPDQPPSGTDGVRNGTETDVDCGGPNAPKCADAKRCSAATDCNSNVCVGKICQAAGPTDGVKNGSETDVDCGGSAAPKCGDGNTCAGATDCTSNICTGNRCVAITSTDGLKNGSETDVDCGGGAAPKCADLKVCALAADCTSGVCAGNACQVPTSTDSVKNGDESDVDCGGTQTGAAKCAVTKACVSDLDCGSDVCSDAKKCTEAPSCRPIRGGETCGEGEYGTAAAKHESCCKMLPVAGLTVMQNGVPKQVYLDKYEITAGRIRTWINAMKAANGGTANIRGWVQARMATDPLLAAMFSGSTSPLTGSMVDFLPANDGGETKPFPVAVALRPNYGNQAVANIDIGLNSQIGPTTYYRGLVTGGTSGCSMALGNYGHRTVWTDDTTRANFGEPSAGTPAQRDYLDEKSANCMTPIMFAAFCAWDGGYVQSQAAFLAAYGSASLPWGDPAGGTTAALINQEGAARANYNINGITNLFANPPRYNYPSSTDFANTLTQLIAPPGRFTQDIASIARPGQESWMDIGGNMLEWYHNGAGVFQGWGGSSFEGHAPANYGKKVGSIFFLDKYGKGSSRCMRLR